MKKFFKVLTMSMLLVGSAAFAQAKIGILNLQQVIQQSPQLTTVKAELQKQFGPAQKTVTDAQKILQDDMANYRKNSAVMSATDKQTLQDKITKEQQDLQATQMKFQQEYVAARDKAFTGLLAQIKSVVETVAKQKKFDLVLTNDAVAYASSDMDITNDVLAALKK